MDLTKSSPQNTLQIINAQMDRKKKKQAAIKSAAHVEQLRKAMKEQYLTRLRKIITLIGGETLLKKFPDFLLEHVYKHRYPLLKAKPAPGTDISKAGVVQFNKLLQELIAEIELTLPNGNKIPLSWFLSEGQTLSDCVSVIETNGHPELDEIKVDFEFCAPESQFYHQFQGLLVNAVIETCILSNDYNGRIHATDITMTPYFAPFNPFNDIILYALKPKRVTIETKTGMRNAIQLNDLSDNFELEYFKVKPSMLGFKTVSLDIPLEIYITTHALERLQERINIVPGVIHQILTLTFLQPKIAHRWMGDVSHVDFLVSGEKVGYLVVKMHGSKLVIHTFLFLTNNHTFEGEKLGRLLSIVKEDKKYLEIDNLSTFNSYNFEKNEKLSQLFKDAGCGSLLKLRHVQDLASNKISDKDPESILQYLADAPYFSRQAAKLD